MAASATKSLTDGIAEQQTLNVSLDNDRRVQLDLKRNLSALAAAWTERPSSAARPEGPGRSLSNCSIRLRFIQTGKPVQNTFTASFTGKFRNECLNEHWFTTLAHTRAGTGAVALGRQCSSSPKCLGEPTPREYAQQTHVSTPAGLSSWVGLIPAAGHDHSPLAHERDDSRNDPASVVLFQLARG